MARDESDREDLLKEATALVRRAELSEPDQTEPVVAGFHKDGRFSIYFGGDAAFHFDPQHRLRRAFYRNHLYRTQGKTLTRLTRERTEESTTLQRHDLTAEELAEFLAVVQGVLSEFLVALRENNVRAVRRVPDDDAALTDDVQRQLAAILQTPLQLAPRFPGKA